MAAEGLCVWFLSKCDRPAQERERERSSASVDMIRIKETLY